MTKFFPALQKNQKIEVYLEDGEIREGKIL